jgi:hypothetical protein
LRHYTYPEDEAPTVFLEPRWLAVPVSAPDSIANCYLSGTGIADFTFDPPWSWAGDEHPLIAVTFRLAFTVTSPLEANDLYIPGSGIASVGLAHVDRDTETYSGPFDTGLEDTGIEDWLLALDAVNVKDPKPSDTELDLAVTAAYQGDCWIDRIAYKIGLLVHRPGFSVPPTQKPARWTVRRDEFGRVVDVLHS